MLRGSTQKPSDSIQKSLQQLWVFLLYIGAARLAILLALPPGYASPIWPAAGIAMAAVIVWGPSLTLAVFMGSIVTNLRLEELAQNPGQQILIQTGLASASALQAYVGAYLYSVFQRRIPQHKSVRNLVLEIIILGPVACLSAATLATATLTAFHLIEAKDFILNWTQWWMGDSFGAGTLCPLLIRFPLNAHKKITKKYLRQMLVIPLSAISIIIGLLVLQLRSNMNNIHSSLEHSVNDSKEQLQQELDRAAQHLAMISELSKTMDPIQIIQAFSMDKPLAESLPVNPYSIWVPRITQDERESFENGQTNSKIIDPIVQRDDADAIIPSPPRPIYWPLIAAGTSPFEYLPHGFNLGSLPLVEGVIHKALVDNKIRVTPIISISPSQKGLILIRRSQTQDISRSTQSQVGLFMVIVPIDQLLMKVNMNKGIRAFHMRLASSHAPEIENIERWLGDDRPESVLDRIPLYGNFRSTLRIADEKLLLRVDFPAEVFSHQYSLAQTLMPILCILFSFAIVVLSLTQFLPINFQAPFAEGSHPSPAKSQDSNQDIDRIKSSLLTSISYQIKTALQGILELLDHVKTGALDIQQRTAIDSAIQGGQSLMDRLEDIFTFASAESGSITINSEDYNITRLLQDLAHGYDSHAKRKVIEFHKTINLPSDLQATGDRKKLRHILNHLMSESFRRTPRGTIRLMASIEGKDPDKKLDITIESLRNHQEAFFAHDWEFGDAKDYDPTDIFNLKTCDTLIQALGGQMKIDKQSQKTIIQITIVLLASDNQQAKANTTDPFAKKNLPDKANEVRNTPNLAIMNYRSFAVGLGEDPDLIQLAISRYLVEIDRYMHQLREALAVGNHEGIAKASFTMKGMSAVFAADSLVEANRALELSAKTHKRENFSAEFKKVEELTEDLKNELTLLSSQKASSRQDVA